VRIKSLVVALVGLGILLPVSRIVHGQQAGNDWSTPIDITQGSTSNWRAFGVLLCDPYQNVHLFWADMPEQGTAAIFYRNDIADSWSVPVDVVSVSYRDVFELTGAISAINNTVHLLWVNTAASGDLYYSRAPLQRVSEPRAWSTPAILDQQVYNTGISIDAAGIVHVVYAGSNETGFQNDVHYIQSADDGITWSDAVLVFSKTTIVPSSIRSQMAIDDSGRIHVGVTVRSQDYGAQSEVGYLRSLDSGQTWSTYHKIDETGTTFQGVAWIAPYAFGDNEIHLTWHNPARMHQWSTDGGVTWKGRAEIMHLGAAFGGANHLAQDSAGTIHVATAVGDGVFSAEWRGSDWSSPQRIDHRPIDLHYQNIVVCQGNQLHITYYDTLGDRTVWYATRQVDAPHIERRRLPESAMLPTPTAIPEATPSAEPTAAPVRLTATSDIFWVGPSTPRSAPPWLSILAVAVPAMILVSGAVIVALKRKGDDD
jgi:hypothetical protein